VPRGAEELAGRRGWGHRKFLRAGAAGMRGGGDAGRRRGGFEKLREEAAGL